MIFNDLIIKIRVKLFKSTSKSGKAYKTWDSLSSEDAAVSGAPSPFVKVPGPFFFKSCPFRLEKIVPLAEKAPLTHHDGGGGPSPVDRKASCCLITGLGNASTRSVRRSTNGNYISTALESVRVVGSYLQ
jgi:hypothetical protein